MPCLPGDENQLVDYLPTDAGAGPTTLDDLVERFNAVPQTENNRMARELLGIAFGTVRFGATVRPHVPAMIRVNLRNADHHESLEALLGLLLLFGS